MAIETKDLVVSTFRPKNSVWANNTDSGVRLTHLPTGISVEESNYRSQHKNRAIALERLEKLVAALEQLGQPKHPVSGAMTDEEIRKVFLANGFTIKDGQTDLKPYVYQAARALISRAPSAQAIRNAVREQIARFIEIQRNDIPATGSEFAAAIRAMQLDAAQPVERPDAVELPELSDDEIVRVLHSLGVDTYPSKYGFDALQVSGTSVPTIRKIVASCLAAIAANQSPKHE